MKFFIDTADIDEIRDAAAMGLVDGVTTNPSLVAKTGRKFNDVLVEICDIVSGPVSAEVISVKCDEMVKEARVLAALREDERARSGDPGAVRDVVVRSSRHVFATTFTTIAGFLPLIIAGGGFWPPLAITIAGGVGGATLLALVFVPSSYLLVNRVRHTAEQTEQVHSEQSPTDAGELVPELATA